MYMRIIFTCSFIIVDNRYLFKNIKQIVLKINLTYFILNKHTHLKTCERVDYNLKIQ